MALRSRTLATAAGAALLAGGLWWALNRSASVEAAPEDALASAPRERVSAPSEQALTAGSAAVEQPGRVPAVRTIEPGRFQGGTPFGLDPNTPQPEVVEGPMALVTTGEVTEAPEVAVTAPAGQCRVQLSNGRCGDPLPGDRDADGVKAEQDCDDTLRHVRPGANEIRCNGIDEDCNGSDLCPADTDRDGFGVDEDCDDRNAARNPHATELPCNGVDEDCSGVDACDRDGDGDPAPNDCDDANAARHTMGKDIVCDAVDQDCDGADCCDQDGDKDGSPCKLDCDDRNPLARPGAPRAVGCNGSDFDCDGKPDGKDCKAHQDDH